MNNFDQKLQGLILFYDESWGIYIPKNFAEDIDRECLQGIDHNDLDDLADPCDNYYWDTWETVLNNAKIVKNGYTWNLFQDGDLWLYCEDLMTDQELEEFFGH